MDKLYRETKANIFQLNDLLSIFENSVTLEDINRNKQNIINSFNQVASACDELDIYVAKEPATRRYESKLRIDQLKYDYQHIKAAFNSIQYKKEKHLMEQKKRDELLRSVNLNSNRNSNEVHLCLEHENNELRYNNRMSRANDELDKMIDHGENLLGSVKIQNSTLKEVKRKILSVSNTLGLSNTLIRMIERRSASDKYILYGGMIITCIIMFLTVRYLI